MPNTSTMNKEAQSLKTNRVTLVGGNTDGKNLYLEVEMFDGEHTNRFEPVFPLDTTAEEITQYFKTIIEKNPKLSSEIVGMMQKTVFWDATEESYYTQTANQKPVRIDDNSDKHHAVNHPHHKKD